MQRVALGVLWSLVVACGGPGLEGDHVKTPDELIADQEALGAEQEKNQRNSDAYDDVSSGPTEDEKSRGWDAKQAELEMHRAAHSAETCPESVTEKAPKGRAPVTVTFAGDGHVKTATIGEPYSEENAVGKCVLRAIKAVIVPAYQGAEQTINWEIDLTGKKKSGPVGGADGEGAEEKK